MKFEIVGKNVSITEGMRQKIEKKLSFLDKYLLIDPETRARVVVRTYPLTQKIEVTIPTKVGILRTEVEHEDLYAAIDLAIDKLEDQVRRQKTRLSRRHREKLALSFVEQDNVKLDQGDIAVRTKTVKAQRMDLEEAITPGPHPRKSFPARRDRQLSDARRSLLPQFHQQSTNA